LPHIRANDLFQAGLVNGDLAPIQCGNLAAVLVNTCHLVTKIGDTCPRNKADIASANHCDPHTFNSLGPRSRTGTISVATGPRATSMAGGQLRTTGCVLWHGAPVSCFRWIACFGSFDARWLPI